MDKRHMMDTNKGHSILPGGIQSSLPSYDTESMELMSHIQDMLNQLLSRGFNSMLVTVGPLGDIGVHGSLKGLNFLKENPDIGDRFSKICSDDVWSLIHGGQKRFLELGRSGQNKGNNFNDKTDFPLDFSHERGSFFQNSENRNGQDNGFVPGLGNQAGQQKQGYQPNFLSGNFNQYNPRPNYPNVPFFQGGFTQGGASTDSFPQSSFMSTIDASSLANNAMDQAPSTSNAGATNTPPPPLQGDKSQTLTQSEADIIKEMLSSSQVHDLFKDHSSTSKGSSKGKGGKKKKEKESSENSKEDGKNKRERLPEKWQKNIKKRLKIEGKAYVNSKGKLIPAKKLLPVDCSKCKQRCGDKISEETRRKIFEWFWKLGSYTAQKEFVVSRVTEVKTKTNKRRRVHRLFSFEINGKYVSVCKPFFSKTLGVGESYIYKAFEQKARDLFVQDGRGKHAPVNKTSAEQIDDVHHHLDCFLSGYSTDRPLPKNVHCVKWFDEYKSYCQEHCHKPVSKHIYRKIFKEYTLKFPKTPEKKSKKAPPPLPTMVPPPQPPQVKLYHHHNIHTMMR